MDEFVEAHLADIGVLSMGEASSKPAGAAATLSEPVLTAQKEGRFITKDERRIFIGGPSSGSGGTVATTGTAFPFPDTFGAPNAQRVVADRIAEIKAMQDFTDLSEAEYLQQTEAEMAKYLTTAEIRIRMSEQSLQSVLDTGEIRNTFDTKSTGAQLEENNMTYSRYKKMRALGEEEVFNIPRNAPGSARPIYGYFSPAKDNERFVRMYGDVILVLKDHVKDRSMFADTDSLDTPPSRFVPSPVRKPSICSTIVGGDILAIWRDGIENYALYVEAQIFGGVTTEDISKVIFERSPTAETTARLTARGIPWEVSAPGAVP